MTKEFKLPELGENIETAQIVKITVKPGDKVTENQSVLEIETDKATVEVPAEFNGIIKEVFAKEGEKVKVGSVVFTYEDGLQTAEEPKKQEEPEVKAEAKPEIKIEEKKPEIKSSGKLEFKLPELGENISAATITKVLVKPGDNINENSTVLEIETDKATVEIPAEISGTVLEVFVKNGDKANVGQVIFTIEGVNTKVEKTEEPLYVAKTSEEPKFIPAPTKTEAPKPERLTPPVITDKVNLPNKIAPAAPSVRRFAREIGIDINMVRGSGKGGRISIEDVKAFAKALNQNRIASTQPASSTGGYHEPLPDFSKFGEIEVVEMSNVRLKTAKHLSFAWNNIPAVTQFDKADITELEKIRKMFSPKVEAKGAKLTITAILLKVVASALKVFPQFNSAVDMQNNAIIYKKYYNIGVAVDTDRGLLVPVIKDVDKKNIIQLALELNEISVKARNKKLGLEDMQGGNFSISNLGGIGGTYFTPIVNSPEVAILGVSKSVFEPVYIDGKFEPRLMLPLSLTYDHRIIDGADGARFIRWIINALEQPFLLTLEG
jgi:pyruvate dehydrogenase E2 component (dihydrolipoamide acetyltransferase)